MRRLSIAESAQEVILADEVACLVTVAREGKVQATVADQLDSAFETLLAAAAGSEHVVTATRSGGEGHVYLERSLDIRGSLDQVRGIVEVAGGLSRTAVSMARYSLTPATQRGVIDSLQAAAVEAAYNRAERLAHTLQANLGEVQALSVGQMSTSTPATTAERVIDLAPALIVVQLNIQVEYELIALSL